MEIYLVRHTETTCEKGICYGQADVALAEPFDQIFEQIASQLPHEALLFSSPLKRCVVLADYLQQQLKPLTYQQDVRLMEMNFGDWELQNWNDIPRTELDPWAADFVNIRVPSGESFTDLHQRVAAFLSDENLKPNKLPLVIITHAGVIRSFLCHQSALPLKEAFQNKVAFGQVIKIFY